MSVLLAGCEKDSNPVDVTYVRIVGDYSLESVGFVKPKAVDLNNDGVASENVLAELKTLPEYSELAGQIGAVVKCGEQVGVSGTEELRADGNVDISLFLQHYERYGITVPGPATEWTEVMYGYIKSFKLHYMINDDGHLSVDSYNNDDGEYVTVTFPEEGTMILTTNVEFHDYVTGNTVSDTRWRFVRK